MTSDIYGYRKPSKLYRREAAAILAGGHVSGSPLMTMSVMLVLCMIISAASMQAAMIIFELLVPLESDSVPLWYSTLENIAAFIAMTIAAGPGWAGLKTVAGGLADSYKYYVNSSEQPGYDLRSLLKPWTRHRYLRGVLSFIVLFITYILPAMFVPFGYLGGRYLGWITPRPFDLPAVLLTNAAGIAIAFAVQRLIAPLTMTARFIYEDGLDPIAAVKKSVYCSRDNESRIFRLRASFVGWAALSVVSCGLAMIWTIPHYVISVRLLEDELIAEAKDRHDISELLPGESAEINENTEIINKDSRDAGEEAGQAAEAENG